MSYVEKAIGHKFDECLSEATPIKALLRVELDLQRFVFPVGGVRVAQLLNGGCDEILSVLHILHLCR